MKTLPATKKLIISLVLVLCLGMSTDLLLACELDQQTPLSTARVKQGVAGIGLCHYCPEALPDDIDWCYDTTRPVHWRTLEPSPGQYELDGLDALLDRSPESVWLSIQTAGAALDGTPKVPDWVDAPWHRGSCAHDKAAIFAPWDPVYQQRLRLLLEAVSDHVGDRAAGIVIMSGGPYGEMQLVSCDMADHLRGAYGLTATQLRARYGAAIKEIIDIYAQAFPELPLMLQVGYSVNRADAAVEDDVVGYALEHYGDQIVIKWAGLDPGASGNKYYTRRFREWGQHAQVGFEPGRPETYQTEGLPDTSKYQAMFDVALDAGASFMCVQEDLLDGLSRIPRWREFDARLEANADSVLSPMRVVPPEVDAVMWEGAPIYFKGPNLPLDGENPNPFLDYRLDLTVRAPSGRVREVVGFYEGAGYWKVYLAADEAGVWTWQVSFRRGDAVAVAGEMTTGESAGYFDGQTGTLTVSHPPLDAGGFYARGRVEYVGEHYLRARDGSAFLKLGANSPEDWLAHSFASHGGPEGAIDYLASYGVNSLYLILMNIGGDGQNVHPFLGPIDPAGSVSNDNLHFDNARLSDWRRIFEYAQARGLFLHLVLGESEAANKRELDNAALGVERKLYYRQMVAHFADLPALQWNISEEYDHPQLALEVAEVREWARWLSMLDAYDHPITVHNAGQEPDPAWRFFLGDELFSTTSLQIMPLTGGNGEEAEKWRALTMQAGRPLPVSLDEVRFTTPDNSAAQRREVLWPILLSGGQLEFILDGTLSVDDYTPFESMWDDVRHARTFMQSIPYWRMAPADDLLLGESGEGQVLASPGEAYAVYLPQGGEAILDVPVGPYWVRYYHPDTGRWLDAGMLFSGGQGLSLSSGDGDDWAVLVE